MNFALDIPSHRARFSTTRQATRKAIRKTGLAIAVIVRKIVNFWNIPALGQVEPNRSPLLRPNWYI